MITSIVENLSKVFGHHSLDKMDTKSSSQILNIIERILATRDHSAAELEIKLQRKNFSPEQIQIAIQMAQKYGWIPQNAEQEKKLSEKLIQNYLLKRKGPRYALAKLRSKRLPTNDVFNQDWLSIAINLLKRKFLKTTRPLNIPVKEQKNKAVRYLINRGFSPSLAHQAWQKLFAELNNSEAR